MEIINNLKSFNNDDSLKREIENDEKIINQQKRFQRLKLGNNEDNPPDICKTKNTFLIFTLAKGCLNIGNCKFQRLLINISDFIYNDYKMTEKFLDK